MGLKVLLSLAISIVLMLNLIVYAHAYDSICVTWITINDHGWYYVWASAHGCFLVPSDGNLYDTYPDGGGWASVPYLYYVIGWYEERGCTGDAYHVITYIYMDANYDHMIDMVDSAYAKVVAPPCGAT